MLTVPVFHRFSKIHALQGHLISLPFIQILIEGLEEIAASSEDTESLLIEIEKEENKEYEDFLAKPLLKDKFNFDKDFGELLQDEDLMETVFKGPSVCRTSLVPSQTRYLGISSNSDKIGGPSEGWLETYDLGVPLHRKDGEYSWEENNEPIPGIVQQTYKVDDRLDSDEWQKECPAVSMPDYKDWLYGPLKDGKTTLTFPNEKEKAYYGYDASTFKGIVGIVPPIWTENHCKCPETDIRLSRFPNHVRTTVNGKPVAKFRRFNSMAILEDENGSIFWEPSENQDYVIEFEPYGEFDGKPAADHHLRLHGVVIY
jgi:DNA-dependent RNA polymerase auxiliary subunit epsilon